MRIWYTDACGREITRSRLSYRLLRSGLVWSVPLFLCISACGRETASAPPEPASPQAAAPAPGPATEPAAPSSARTSGRAKPIKSFAIYTLSRGTGVPPAAREALEQVTNLVESDRKRGVRVTVETTRIGLEGEKRMCVEYENPTDGARAWERASAIVKGVDLVNLKAEPCASATATETQK
jgi:hypothetical protein